MRPQRDAAEHFAPVVGASDRRRAHGHTLDEQHIPLPGEARHQVVARVRMAVPQVAGEADQDGLHAVAPFAPGRSDRSAVTWRATTTRYARDDAAAAPRIP